MKKDLEKAKTLLSKADRLVILTGAGISAESGIRTFRDAGGLWEDHSIEDVATPEGFKRDPLLVWKFYNARRKAADVATPNPAHIALARLESLRLHRRKMKPPATNGHANGNGKSHHSPPPPMLILTQNIDGLHQQAGSQNVLELHGSIWKVRCTGCDILSEDFPIEVPLPARCEECGSLLRPHVVWFGEPLDQDVLQQAEEATLAADVFLVIGTSAVVHPAASYPFLAAKRKTPIIEVNLEKTPVSEIAAVSLLGKAGEILPELL